jgi:DNA-binding XRE family transcriptional regulator
VNTNHNDEDNEMPHGLQRWVMQDAVASAKGNHLKAVRHAQKLSLWGLAARAGISPSTLSAVEKWGYRPSAGLRQRIAVALEVPVEMIWPEQGQDDAEA